MARCCDQNYIPIRENRYHIEIKHNTVHYAMEYTLCKMSAVVAP